MRRFSQGGTEILESLGYTEYTGFALQYPRAVVPEYFADHIGNLTVELVLAVVEISTLIVHTPPTMDSLLVLQESEPFPGNDPEGWITLTVIIVVVSAEFRYFQHIIQRYPC